MKPTPRLALLTVSIVLSACSTETRQAPVIDRPAPTAANKSPRPHPPVVAPSNDEPKADARGSYTVRRGDTLLKIALDFGQNYRDIVAWNNLANPDDIKVGQVLRVLPLERNNGNGNNNNNGLAGTNPITMPGVDKPAVPPKKIAPRGDKKPYTEGGLADAKDDNPGVNPKAAERPSGGLATGSVVTANDDEKLSWMWPSNGRIIATFDDGKSKGIDIAGRLGQQVMAASPGKVMYAGSGIRGYGNLVIVKHSNTLLSAYAHNRAILVKEGESVAKGQAIAEMGDSDADTVKLHFEIRLLGKPVDPSKYLPSR
ncbi:peptidoglycan DD-metalloendopeptidase family protein [Massilia norwichensis]|uniref:Peptidoglycan DD-metalloendopeptidase family protein n=1 Tax=Massilia norwichensis TaxID=1442366 RepID=A0ABT2AB68_9BURK|nr:peptidoglycan DD-metalloendopeptidase family protein [Massilia norwichensis]MCS0591312.1 peptidoglycan DD-metalloendopeptidase family protein [Massilia norwichensis]